MADKWDWYRAAIAAKNSGKDLPPVSDGVAHFGFFYQKASRDGGRIPVCIFADKNGDMVARSGTRDEHRIEDAANKWSWIAGNPVERAEYVYAWEEGKWPDGTPTTAPKLPAGSNAPTDPFQRLQYEVDDKMSEAKAFLERMAKGMASKVDADMARNIQAGLLTHIKTADVMHKTEKQPHLDAGKAVDDKYRFRETVKGIADRLRTIFENFMRAEEAKARAEADRKHREAVATALAERERIEADRRKKMADDPVAALTEDEPEMPLIPTAPEPVKINVGGGVGRAAGLKSEWHPEIIDYEATVHHYRLHPDVQAAVEKIVARTTKTDKSATNIPGVKVTEVRKAA